VDEVAQFIREQGDEKNSSEITEFPTWDAGGLLTDYLDLICIAKIEAFSNWNSNIHSGYVGVQESELVSIFGKKAHGAKNSSFDEHWLVVAGGGALSGVIGAISAEHLASYQEAAAILEKSNFSQVHLIDLDMHYLWTLGEGWRLFGT
jgi:hypothetical protein